jgi:uncharacterized protein
MLNGHGGDLPLPLYGIFCALRERKVPLGLRDYLEALDALRLGYPWSQTEGDRPSRNDLRVLCKMLWTRREAEARLVDSFFDRISPAKSNVLSELEKEFPALSPALGLDVREEDTAKSRPEPEDAPRVSISIVSGREEGGFGLPQLDGITGLRDGSYELLPETVLPPRSLAVIFRRIGRRVRRGPKCEIDVLATIRERGRIGVASTYLLRARLASATSLIILADANAGMAPWRPFLAALSDALVLSRLRGIRLFYFDEVVDELVYHRPDLTNAMMLDELLAEMPGAPVLIVSDAGAARGSVDTSCIDGSLALLNRLAGESRRIVWINPMPRYRWAGSSASVIARHSHGAAFLELDGHGDELIRAVDILRGVREG